MENKIENQNTQQKPEENGTFLEQEKKPENQQEAKDKKGKKVKKPRRPAKVVLKTWSKGLGKQGSRIAWEKKSQVIKDFVVILVISVILAVLFFAIDMIVITIRK